MATLGEQTGDAAAIGRIRWAAHEGCERLVINLLTTDGAPARTLDEASVSFRPAIGVVRIGSSMRTTGIADSVIEGKIVDRVYIVRLGNGNLAVDVHLTNKDPITVRGFDVSGPSRVVVDLASSDEGTGWVAAPAIGQFVILLAPLSGPADYKRVCLYIRGERSG